MVKFQKNVSLKKYTTFKIGGKAKYFFVAKTKEDLIGAIKMAKKMKLPFFIFGGGSNLLVSDDGFKGLVIKILNSKFYILNSKIIAGAGTLLGQLVNATTRVGLTGLEWAVGIPGTVGGAIWGNAGAFNSSMAKIVKSVEVLEIQNAKIKMQNENLKFKIKKLKNKDCKFGYRESVFKHKKNLIILSAELQLKKGKPKEIEKKIQENLKSRKEKQPLNFPSAGSIFKNPAPKQSSVRGRSTGFSAGRLKGRASPSAGELIEKCGLKGKKVGNVKISEKHANFIVNLGGGKAKDVMKLIKIIKTGVKKKFRVTLEEEIQFL